MSMMSSNKTRIFCIVLGIVVCCLVGIANLYDKFIISRFLATAISLAIVFTLAIIRRKPWVAPRTFVFYIYLLFLFFCGCSIIWATNTAEAVFAYNCLLLTPLVIIVIYSLLSDNRHLTQKALWFSSAIILSVYLLFAIVQLFHVKSFSFEQLYSVCGINGHKNMLAVMLFVLSSFLLTSFSIFETKLPKALSVVLFIIAILVIILLKSRAVLLGIVVAYGFFGVIVLIRTLLCKKQKQPSYLLTLTASIVLVYIFITVGLRWFSARSVPHTSSKSEVETKMTSTSSLVERCVVWDKTYHIVDQRPIIGYGIGNWQIHFPDAGLKGLYRSDLWNVNFTKPHNEYLGVLAETGYLGLLLFVVFLVSLIVLSFFALCKTPNRKDFFYGAIVLSTFVGSCFNALFDFPNSRIEHIIWMGILMAILFQTFTYDHRKTLGIGWSIIILLITIMQIAIGGIRLKGELNVFKMQQALRANDWKAVEQYCHKAISLVYTIDPVGLPLHWYQGKAERKTGNPRAIESFRQAQHYAPYCRENLNDLGLAEYHTAHDLTQAEYYLKEAIRISPNYLYPYFNLAYIYLNENEPQKAKEVADDIYFDEHKREVMKADAVFFEPFNAEAIRQKIDADYKATQQLNKTIQEALQNYNEESRQH